VNYFHLTAIVRRKPSLPLRELIKRDLIKGRLLDYGCGRGFDADFLGAEKYDPFGFPDPPTGRFDTILCAYVLNVVDEITQAKILKHIAILLTPNGQAFISVRRDKDCLKRQRWVILQLPIVYEKSRAFCIYSMNKPWGKE